MVTKFSGEGLFLTSDSHFNHFNILQLCNRPFSSIEEHDQALINNWNSVVGLDDTVFHLGDFCFGNVAKWKEIRDQLNGHIILIVGNHDVKQLSQGIVNLFDHVSQQMRIQVDGRTVYLNHFPFLTFAHGSPDIYRGDSLFYQCYGHVHSRPQNTGYDAGRLKYCYPTQYDVGVDNNNYKPISWKELDEKIQKQITNPITENKFENLTWEEIKQIVNVADKVLPNLIKRDILPSEEEYYSEILKQLTH